MDINELTAVEKHGNHYYKRDDYFQIHGVRGGKSRSAYQIILKALDSGYKDFVTAGSRMSPQCEIVSCICEQMGLNAHLFMPSGKETSVIGNINKNKNSVIHKTKVGYNSVICHHAEVFAKENNYYYIPFGMECLENIEITKKQVQNIPEQVKHIVMPCGSGMSMISVIKGLNEYRRFDVSVTGVIVGKSPDNAFKRFLQNNLFETNMVEYNFVHSQNKYDEMPSVTCIDGVELDPVYESKCIPFVNDGDLLWIVGKRL
jgi:1-aminocyclopropane-1-carboxylate deaminase/D-cysteine desulfhydrase-like pyridoxal-dependent ACC family enzyme